MTWKETIPREKDIILWLLQPSLDKSMPTALRIGSYRFYFYSYDCREPRHMHVDREGMSAKFWLDPVVSLAENHGYSRKELRQLEQLATEHLETLRNEWDAFCNGDIHIT